MFVVVGGNDPAEFGAYSLDAKFRVPTCGDAHIDAFAPYFEECDDGNTVSGDGCSAACAVQTDEIEPDNGQAGSADACPTDGQYWYARIFPEGDQDYLTFDVMQAGSSIEATTYDLGDGGCDGHLLDTLLTLYGPNDEGLQTVLPNDDSGNGTCSHVVAASVFAGTYYVLVQAGPNASPKTFAYALQVVVTPP